MLFCNRNNNSINCNNNNNNGKINNNSPPVSMPSFHLTLLNNIININNINQ